MKKPLVLAALTLALGTVHQAVACDMGAITAYVARTVSACQTSDCATDEQTTQQGADCTRSNCAKTEPAVPTVATDKLLAPSLTLTDGGCTRSNC